MYECPIRSPEHEPVQRDYAYWASCAAVLRACKQHKIEIASTHKLYIKSDDFRWDRGKPPDAAFLSSFVCAMRVIGRLNAIVDLDAWSCDRDR